jgi:xyloglucan-specific exo-beta-1,4-glucanase
VYVDTSSRPLPRLIVTTRESIATDPVDPKNLYIEVGLYTNSWDPNNGTVLKSTNQGTSFTSIPLPFKVGGNMPGRGAGERLVIDPNNNKVLYLGMYSPQLA